MTSESQYRECYKTILFDLENPIGVFTNQFEKLFEWSVCDSSASTNVNVFDYTWFDTTASQTVYTAGSDIVYDTRSVCTGVLFSNPISASVFDLVVHNYAGDRRMGKSPK